LVAQNGASGVGLGKEPESDIRFPPFFLPCIIGCCKISDAAVSRVWIKAHRMRLRDKHGREITDLRVSVTDRCNYRCVYCRTGNEGAQYSELPLADYFRLVRIFVELGIEKVRLTGGEPLLRKGLVDFVRDVASLRTLNGNAPDIAITTNGHLLADLAEPLKRAGLRRATVSMDAVDAEKFARITRVPRGYQNVLAGIRAAKQAGLEPVKVNCVLLRGFNEDQIVEFARFSREEGVIVRFIEFMPLEEDRVWSPNIVITMDEILEALNRFRPVRQLPPNALSETARRFTFDDGLGEIGIIAPVSHPFCGHCSRVRLTSDGKIRTCLFSLFDHDLAARMHSGANDEELRDYVRTVVDQKEARHHIGEAGFIKPSRSMVHIGG
jgi:GTP 3',8-cyclase